MNNQFKYGTKELCERYPQLKECENSINEAFEVLKTSFENGGKLLIAGNGGSSADADHIVGELMKGFKNKRPINEKLKQKIVSLYPENGLLLAESLQQGLPAIALHNHQGMNTAFINDVKNGGSFTFAQQVLGYGNKGDILLGISTSGNAENIYNAAVVAKAKGITVIGLTGFSGGRLNSIADIMIKAPASETFVVQELHLPIYHCLCLMLEKYFFE